MTDTLTVDTVGRTVTVPHLGLTLRSIMGAAVKASYQDERVAGRRLVYSIRYREVTIGQIRLKQLKGAESALQFI